MKAKLNGGERVYGQWKTDLRRICPVCGEHLKREAVNEHREGPCGYRSIIFFTPILYLVCPVCNEEYLFRSPETDKNICRRCGCIMEDGLHEGIN